MKETLICSLSKHNIYYVSNSSYGKNEIKKLICFYFETVLRRNLYGEIF